MKRMIGLLCAGAGLAGGVLLGAGLQPAEASHKPGTRKHKIVYHLNENSVEKAKAVLGNMLNHVKGVGGWDHIEDLVLVTHGGGIMPLIEAKMDPEVRKRFDLLYTGGLELGVCGNTLRKKDIKLEAFRDGTLRLDQGGVTAVMEYQEEGYVYIKP